MTELITPERFDLGAKILYAKYRINGIKTTWHVKLYEQHILVFNGGWEYPGTKTKLCQFTEVFNNMIDHFTDEKAGKISVGKNGVIINGAHRVSIAFVKGVSLVLEFKDYKGCEYNYNFFADRLRYGMAPRTPKVNQESILPSLDRIYSDEIALEFCRICPSLRIITLFPTVDNDSSATQIIRKYGKIVYALSLKTSLKGLDNLIKEFYRGESWIGGFYATHSMGKSQLCWDPKNPYVRIYLFLPTNLQIIDETCKSIKKEIRSIYKIGNHSVHINDTHEETTRIGCTVFNQNSFHFLQNSKACLSATNRKLFSRYRELAKSETFCISGSFILALYGLRTARDLDYIHNGQSLGDSCFDSHNKYEKLFNTTIDDIIYNPSHHFYFAGVKVISLDTIRAMKSSRGEAKDKKDVELIDSCFAPVESRII